jgi:hypothetical protein
VPRTLRPEPGNASDRPAGDLFAPWRCARRAPPPRAWRSDWPARGPPAPGRPAPLRSLRAGRRARSQPRATERGTTMRRRRSPRQAGASPLHPCPVPGSFHSRRPGEPLRGQPEPARERRPEAQRATGAARAAEEAGSGDRRIRLPRTTPGRPGGRTASATRPHRCHPQLPPCRPLRPSHPSRPTPRRGGSARRRSPPTGSSRFGRNPARHRRTRRLPPREHERPRLPRPRRRRRDAARLRTGPHPASRAAGRGHRGATSTRPQAARRRTRR